MLAPIRALEITGGDLERVPEVERVLLIQLGHLHNTIQFLRRWLLSARAEGSDGAENHAALAQHSLAARMLAGVLCEGWTVLETSFFGSGVSQGYVDDLSVEGSAAIRTLKDYFSQSNLLRTVRNRFAFHFDRREILRQVQAFEDTDSSSLYVSEEAGNSLYYLSETIVGLSVLSALGEPVDKDTMQKINDRLHGDLLEVSGAFDRVIGEYLGHVLTRYLPADLWERAPEIQVAAFPVDRLNLPFFLARPEAREGV